MATTTRPVPESRTLETPRRRAPARRTLVRACWIVIDVLVTLACLIYAIQALT
jgi:hypothetical protein